MSEQHTVLENKTISSKDSSKRLMTIIFVMVLAAFAGLIYTNFMLVKSNNEVKTLTSRLSNLSSTTAKLEEVSKKGASDELLGFDKVDDKGFQAVFLSGGQVYFGKISSMTTENFVLERVYYLKVNGSDQSLVKLGCEIHQPEDKMTIVRSNVEMWENLKDSDKNSVTTAIRDYEKQNPNGQKCE